MLVGHFFNENAHAYYGTTQRYCTKLTSGNHAEGFALQCFSLFKFRSGTHGLNEELGRHRGREGNKECELCGNECESVSHVLWECSAYSSSRAEFLLKLQEKLGNGFERFDELDSLS